MIVYRPFFLESDALLPGDLRDRLIDHAREMGDKIEPEHIGYWGAYYGLARKFAPRTILEIGVRYGYTAAAMLSGASSLTAQQQPIYLGLDNESYVKGSSRVAATFLRSFGFVAHIWQIDTQTAGLPTEIAPYDMIHIDGDHTTPGALNDLVLTWPVLQPGGVLIVDDYGDEAVREGVRRFLALMSDVEADADYCLNENIQGHIYLRKPYRGREGNDGQRNRAVHERGAPPA